MSYDVWTKEELFENFIPGFYFTKNRNHHLSVIKLSSGINDAKIFSGSSGKEEYLAQLSENVIIYGPIPTP